MATITTTSKVTINGGSTSGAQQIVGINSGKNQVVRFTFTTDSNGASSVSWSLPNNSKGAGTAPALRWYIGTDPNSHLNAGASTTVYNGNVSVSNDGYGNLTFSGSANMVLVPNTIYYLWIFPGTTTYGFYYLTENQQATLTTSGGAGVVYIDNGSSWDLYQCYIDNGSGWDLYIPYIDNGSSWDIY